MHLSMYFVIAFCCLDIAHTQRYHEKTRFDRSVNNEMKYVVKAYLLQFKRARILSDFQTHIRAYKVNNNRLCYLEKMTQHDKYPVSTVYITKTEAWIMAGEQIVNFCKGAIIILIQEIIPIPNHDDNSYYNELSNEDNDIFFKYPDEEDNTIGAAKKSTKQYILKNPQKTTHKMRLHKKREALPFIDRFHGQTQSQYLNIDTNRQNEGKAEAQATQQSSRAVVSGSSGIGQAQSMSFGSGICENCSKYNKPSNDSENLILGAQDYLTGIERNTQREKSQSEELIPNIRTIQSTGTNQGMQIFDRVLGTHFSNVNSSQGTQRTTDVYPSNITFSKKEKISNSGIEEATEKQFSHIIQIPDIHKHSSRFQAERINILKNQISGTNAYPQVMEGVEDQTSNVQIKGNKYPTDTLIADNHYLQIQVPWNDMYNKNNQIKMDSRYLDTQIPEKKNNSSNTKSISDFIPPNQIESTNEPSTQIIENYESNSQISKENIFTSNTQKRKETVYPTSIQIKDNPVFDPRAKAYRSGTPVLIDNTQNAQISEMVICPPGNQIRKENMPNNVILRQIPYSEIRQIVNDDILKTNIRGNNMDSSNNQVVRISNEGKEIPQVSIYSPETPLKANSASAQIPGSIIYLSRPQIAPNNNVDAPNLNQIKYLPIIQKEGVDNLYLPSTQVIIEDILKSKIPQESLYQSNTQMTINNTPQNTLLREPVYFSHIQLKDYGAPRAQVLNTILNPTKMQVDDSVTNIKIPEQINSLAKKVGTGTSEIQIPNSGYPHSSRIILDNNLGMQNSEGNYYLPEMRGINLFGTQISDETAYPVNIQNMGDTISRTHITEDNVYPFSRSNMRSSALKYQNVGENIYIPGTWIPNRDRNTQSTIANTKRIKPLEGAYISSGTLDSQTSFGSQDKKYPQVTNMEDLNSTINGPIQPSIPAQFISPETGKMHPSVQMNYPSTNISPGNIEKYTMLKGSEKYERNEATAVPNTSYALESNLNFPKSSKNFYVKEHEVVINQRNKGVIKKDDTSDSQAMSSVKQGKAGTLASASAQGKHGQGNAKSQVSGIYTGTGSFSAQAGTSDDTKSAQTQVSASKGGVQSNAEGNGGLGKSQTQVQLDSDSGITSTNAQSNGWNHNTNSQVEASAKGGMADAQANGDGQTSSQAQIGFQPYINRNEKLEKVAKPFHGGGTASAQSNTFIGQSQSQLQGSFHYGISYSGTAQASSGAGSTALKKINFTDPESKLFKSIKFEKHEKIETTTQIAFKEHLKISNANSKHATITMKPNYKYLEKPFQPKQPYSYDLNNADDEYKEYEYENNSDLEYIQPVYGLDETNQTMASFTNTGFSENIKHENNTGDSLPGYIANTHKRYMTSSLTKQISPKNITSQNKTVIALFNGTISKPSYERFLHSNRVGGIYYGNLKNYRIQEESLSPKTNFVSVSNNIAGKMEDTSLTKNYEHRYYTKTSTCGYFTFSCNLVYGSSGISKICKPKIPTYPDKTSKC